jgi:mannosyltransferase
VTALSHPRWLLTAGRPTHIRSVLITYGVRMRVPCRVIDPCIAGIVATIVGAAWSWRPSFWFDEAATIAGAERSETDILRLVPNFDAVHGLYYLAMHEWFRLVPINEFTARLPSAIAVGVGAAGMVVLARLITDRQTACAAAAAFTILPCTLWSAIEARSYALTAALAVWLTVVLIIAAKRRSATLWGLYALLLALAIVTFIYLSTLVAAHAVTLLALRQARRALFGLIPAASAGLILASPVIALGVSQRKQQLSWISGMRTNYPRAVLLDQWFTGSWMSAAACAIVVACGIGVLLTTKRNAAWPLAVAVPWFVIPTAGLLAYSAMYENTYLARHLTFTTPGVGLLLGVCVTMVTAHRVRLTVIVLIVLALASLAAFVTQRQTDSKPGDGDYSAIADVIAAQAKPGDCVGFDTKPYEPLRAVAVAYPHAFADMKDIAAGMPAAYRAQLLTQDLPLDSLEVAARLRSCSQLWAVIGRENPSKVLDSATKQQLVIERRWVLKNDEVVLLGRH